MSPSTSFHERRRLALQKWGRAKQRPQITYPHFLDFRRDINNFDFSTIKCHPFHNNINNWKPSPAMLKPFDLQEINSANWIETEEQLQELATKLECQTVIAMDFEGNCDSYYDVTCLWQISTIENNYIVDCLKLFSCVSGYLGPIMANPNILKVVHDAGDVVNLQRDFNIFSQALVDMQEAYCFIDPPTPNISFKNLVKSFLGYDVDKLPQLADWRIRPLPEELKEYAINDSRFLLKCWFLLITESDLSPCKFLRSKKAMQKCYRPPSTSDPIVLWRQSIQKLHSSCRPLFDNLKLQSLFVSLFKWRDEKCKFNDVFPNQFLALDKLALITRAQPTTISNLKSMCNNVNSWSSDCMDELFKLIENNESQIIIEDVPAPILPVSRRNFNVPDYCSEISDCDSDWSVEDMEVEVQNSTPPPQEIQIVPPVPQNITPQEIPVSNQHIIERVKVLTGKNRKNVMKKIRLWGNRFKRNQERVEKGLIPIRYYRNKGLKHKIRQAERKRRELHI